LPDLYLKLATQTILDIHPVDIMIALESF
jgi:hypothetical protein